MSGPTDLRTLAASIGIAEDDIAAAEADGTLGLLLMDRFVTDPGTMTLQEAIDESGLGEEGIRFWRALGFPDPDPDDRAFGPADVEMLRLVDAVVRLQLIDRDTLLQLTRVIGSSIERIAQAQVDAVEARVDADDPAADGALAVQRAQLLLPMVPRILEYVWRRHLQAASRRRMVRDTMAADGQRIVTVGFADLVGFTALAQQIDDRELAQLVDRFEALAYDLVSGHGGRVVKMIGDEVMYEVGDPAVGVQLGLDLADAYHDAISDVRVGIATGPVLSREGDLFGPTVNLAHRIVSIAYPGSVVVSSEVRRAIDTDERFTFTSMRTRYLKDIGKVQLHVARRPGDVETLGERARRRRRAFSRD